MPNYLCLKRLIGKCRQKHGKDRQNRRRPIGRKEESGEDRSGVGDCILQSVNMCSGGLNVFHLVALLSP